MKEPYYTFIARRSLALWVDYVAFCQQTHLALCLEGLYSWLNVVYARLLDIVYACFLSVAYATSVYATYAM